MRIKSRNQTRNLFLKYHMVLNDGDEQENKLGWEKLFTEFFTFFLATDHQTCSRIASYIVNDKTIKAIWIESEYITEWGRPDIVIGLNNGSAIALEVKFQAALGLNQLERYLQIAITGVKEVHLAMIGKKYLNIREEVLLHPNYKSPPQRSHYLWQDIYQIIPDGLENDLGLDYLRREFRGYMRNLRLSPTKLTDKWERLFEDRSIEENREVKLEFSKLLNGVRFDLAKKDMKVTRVSYSGWQAKPVKSRLWLHMFIGPHQVEPNSVAIENESLFDPDASALVLELTFGEKLSSLVEQLKEKLPPEITSLENIKWVLTGPRKLTDNKRIRLGYATPLAPLMKKELSEELFREICEPVISVLCDIK